MKDGRKKALTFTLVMLLICAWAAAASLLLPKKDERPAEDTKEETDITLPEKDAEEEPQEKTEDNEVQDEKEDPPEGGDVHHEDGSAQDMPQGGSEYGPGSDPPSGGEPEPIYDYFEEGGWLICRGCYRPFADVRALNAHECSYHESQGCEHDWAAEYNDVWVEATGHYEQGVVQEAYDEPVYEERVVCRKCGEYFSSSAEAAAHIVEVHGNEGSWTVAEVIVSYIHHDAVYGEIFVTDEEAHWERELYRYRCKKCGEIKYPE